MWRDVFFNNREALPGMLARFAEGACAPPRAVRREQAESMEDRIRRGLIGRKQA